MPSVGRVALPRWSPRLGAGVAVAVPVVLLLVTRDEPQLDLEVYRDAARRLLAGRSLYDQPPGDLPFTYPPFAALLAVPLALLPDLVASAVVPVLSCACLALVWGRMGLDARLLPLLGLSLVLEPVWSTLHFGQVNLLLGAVVLLDLARPGGRWYGVGAGIAAGIKLTPLIFVALLLVNRDAAAVRRFLVAFLATALLPLLVAPSDVLRFWVHVLPDAERIGAPWFAANQGVMGALARLGGDAAWVRPVWLLLAGTVALLLVWLARRLWLAEDRVASVSAVALAALLASPVSWSHHWTWAVPLAVVLGRWTRPWAGVAWAAGFVVAPHLWLPRGDGAELAWTWEHVPGNTYLWLGLTWSAVMAVAVSRRRPSPASPRGLVGTGSPSMRT